MTDNWEKKSERFEVRLPHSKKQDFVKACEDQGDTPSHAVRRFINAYIRRADADTLKMALQSLGAIVRRNWIKISGGLAIVLFAIGISSQSFTPAPHVTDGFFSQYDKDGNGIIETGEITSTDRFLFAVLDIDSKPGISPKELFEKGKMIYTVGDIKKWNAATNHRPVLVDHYRAALRDTVFPTLITFDLSDYQNPKIEVTSLKENMDHFDGRQDRIVIRGNDKPVRSRFGLSVSRNTLLVINSWDYALDKG